MELETASFCQADIEQHGHGAGIVPVAVHPDGTLRALLGRERYAAHWRGSCRWSGFEGSRKDGETMAQTAQREYNEESMGVLPLTPHDHLVRIVLRIYHERRKERYHATYVVPSMWDVGAPHRFLQARMHVEHLERVLLAWRYHRPADVVDGIECLPGGGVALHVPETRLSPWAVREAERRVLVGKEAAAAVEWARLRDRVEALLSKTAPAMVRVTRSDAGFVQRVLVDRDFLEKDQVRWWSLDELRQVLESRGQLGYDRFRPYFLPVLQTLVQEMTACARAIAARTRSSAARTAAADGASTCTKSSRGCTTVQLTYSAVTSSSSASRSAEASVLPSSAM